MGLFEALPDCFMKKVLQGENPEDVENLLKYKVMFDKETDKEKKAVYRDRLANAFWNVYFDVAKNIRPSMSKEKRLFLRYGILDLKYLTPEDQKMILSVKFEDKDPEDMLFYVDEWLLMILDGKLKPSMSDETSPKTSAEKKSQQNNAKIERLQGALEAEKKIYQDAVLERSGLEDEIRNSIEFIFSHGIDPLTSLPDKYTDEQLKQIEVIIEKFKMLKNYDRIIAKSINDYAEKHEELQKVKAEVEALGGDNPQYTQVDVKVISGEIENIRQMIKMSVGRQGNHFPILTSNFLPRETKEYNFKHIAYNNIKAIENLDPSIFERTFKQVTSRIPPYILLLPGYGNYGFCWEPYDKYNKATSRGRVMIPIFSKNPQLSIIYGFADFRWSVAKEMAGHHWMDEGLTGKYYQVLDSQKFRGDMKAQFITDYVLWISKESQGMQKLDKEVRYIFWRYIPFPDKLKEELSKKGYYYNELWTKELIYRNSQG